MLFSLLISFFSVLFSVMFITLLERKLLSYTQNRMGPNKVSVHGVLQPMLDGFKLLLKESIYFSFLNKKLFVFGPILFLILMAIIWISFPSISYLFSFSFSMIFIMMCIGLSVYTTLVSGWSSNSKFSMIGAIRSMSQTISYEISLAAMIFCFLCIFSSMSLLSFLKLKSFVLFSLCLPLILIWYLSLIAECNRAPFDFAEGESELVSGFNTEFSSGLFAFLFIGEYGMILFFSILSFLMFFSNNWVTMGFIFIFVSLMLVIRSVYPRFRYDKLMFLAWFKFLPVVIIFVNLMVWENWI